MYPGQVNCLMCRIDGGLSVTGLTLRLLEKTIFIEELIGRKCLEDGSFFRVAVRNREDNSRLLEALRKETG